MPSKGVPTPAPEIESRGVDRVETIVFLSYTFFLLWLFSFFPMLPFIFTADPLQLREVFANNVFPVY